MRTSVRPEKRTAFRSDSENLTGKVQFKLRVCLKQDKKPFSADGSVIQEAGPHTVWKIVCGTVFWTTDSGRKTELNAVTLTRQSRQTRRISRRAPCNIQISTRDTATAATTSKQGRARWNPRETYSWTRLSCIEEYVTTNKDLVRIRFDPVDCLLHHTTIPHYEATIERTCSHPEHPYNS